MNGEKRETQHAKHHLPEDWTQKVKSYVNVENVIAFLSHAAILCLGVKHCLKISGLKFTQLRLLNKPYFFGSILHGVPSRHR